MTAVRLQGRTALLLFIHHTRWHTKWKLFFEVSHTIKMTHCYAAHLGFSLLFLKKPPNNHKLKTEVTWSEKRLSQWSQQTAMSACESLRPPFGTRLIKTTSILLWNQLEPFTHWWTLLSPLISQTWPKPTVYVFSWHLDERKKQRPLPHLCTAQSILSEASKNNTNFHNFLLSHELLQQSESIYSKWPTSFRLVQCFLMLIYIFRDWYPIIWLVALFCILMQTINHFWHFHYSALIALARAGQSCGFGMIVSKCRQAQLSLKL